MKIVTELARKDLILAVWSAEFVRALSTENGHNSVQERTRDPVILQQRAERSAAFADHAIEMLRLLVEVTFRKRTPNDEQHMTWGAFVSHCRAGTRGLGFTNHDGFAELPTADHVSNLAVYPSDAIDSSYVPPAWATHVLWRPQ